MMNPMLTLKVSIYVTCIQNALATAGHLAKSAVGVWEGLYNPPARQSLAGDMVKPDIYETVRCNPPIGRENNIIHHTGNFQCVITKYSQIFK